MARQPLHQIPRGFRGSGRSRRCARSLSVIVALSGFDSASARYKQTAPGPRLAPWRKRRRGTNTHSALRAARALRPLPGNHGSGRMRARARARACAHAAPATTVTDCQLSTPYPPHNSQTLAVTRNSYPQQNGVHTECANTFTGSRIFSQLIDNKVIYGVCKVLRMAGGWVYIVNHGSKALGRAPKTEGVTK